MVSTQSGVRLVNGNEGNWTKNTYNPGGTIVVGKGPLAATKTRQEQRDTFRDSTEHFVNCML
jgi:hypothetical protein